MTESQWRTTTDVPAMLAHLLDSKRASPRKLRLFACACVRREVSYLLCEEPSRAVVEVAERFADGEASEADRALAEMAAFSQPDWEDGFNWDSPPSPAWFAAEAAVNTVCAQPEHSALHTSASVLSAMAGQGLLQAGLADQADLLRDVFGPLLFRPLPAIDPVWVDGNDGAVRKLAESIYRDRRWQDLSIVADALEDAGCSAAELVEHFRAGPPHARGCWALDALLGKA
jgi:hypothetical protein